MKLGCLSRLVNWEKAAKREEKVKLGCLSRLVNWEKAAKREEKVKLGCLSRLVKWEKAAKSEEKVKLGCLSRLVKWEKAAKKEEKVKLGCLFPRHLGIRKSKSLQRCKEMPPRLRHDGRTPPAIKLLTSVNKAGSCLPLRRWLSPRLTPLSRIFVAAPVVISLLGTVRT